MKQTFYRKSILFISILLAYSLSLVGSLRADDPVIYSVFRNLDLGNPGEKPQKDYYLNIGTAQGMGVGKRVEVFRRISTYDLLSEKLYKDVTFPIGVLTVIHAEQNAAIARLEKLYPSEKTPATIPQAVMVGDIIKPLR